MNDASRPWSSAGYWNARFQNGDTPWERGIINDSLAALLSDPQLDAGARVLVPGCGRGVEALFTAKRGLRVTAFDWSQEAIDSLRTRAVAAALPLEAHVMGLDDMPPEWSGAFDLWLEKSFFCALDPTARDAYFEHAARVLRPGGLILGLFYVGALEEAPERFSSPGPPFLSDERELRRQLEPCFEPLRLEPSPLAAPDRARYEWWAILRRRIATLGSKPANP